MKVVIGLGNPGKEYELTRHNVGFLILDALALRHNVSFTTKRSLEAEIAEIATDGQKRLLLVKPQTFMNASGRTFSQICSKYPVLPEDFLIVYDDADLPFGDLRLKQGGGSAGHRGMQSILANIPKGTIISRLRIGIGRPPYSDMALDEFVLGRWSKQEEAALQELTPKAIELIEKVLSQEAV